MSFEMISSLTDNQFDDLHRMYQAEWWTRGRHLPDIRRAIENSDIILAFCDPDSRRLVAFARVLTDYVYKALIFDVIVEAASRGGGLGQALIDSLVKHHALKQVKHFELYCRPEMVPFYNRWEFTDDLGELRFMRKTKE
jgi:GNAT superfamily N-acetyltransferase